MITLPRNRKGLRECIGRILIGEGCRRRACQSSIFTRYYYVVRPSQAGVNDEHEPAQLPGRSPRPERPDLSPDFLNGALLASAGLLLHGNAPPISPADAFDGYGGIGDYRHSNGNIWDVLRAGHAIRDGAFERRLATAIDTGEIYDLVAVGG